MLSLEAAWLMLVARPGHRCLQNQFSEVVVVVAKQVLGYDGVFLIGGVQMTAAENVLERNFYNFQL